METANNAFGTLCNALAGHAVKPVKGAKGVAYTMGKTNYVEVDGGSDASVEKAVKVAAPKADKPAGTPTKADAVRGLIAFAKAASDAQDVVILRVVETMGMARGQASIYVKNNWDKV